MVLMLTPLEVSDALLAAVRCLHEEAAAAAAARAAAAAEAAAAAAAAATARIGKGTEGGKRRVLTQEHSLPADVLFPLLVYAVVWADCPDVFSCLYVLRHFASGVENVGEKAYYITTLEAAVAHVFYREEEEEGGKERREGEGEEEGEEEQVSLEELGPCFTVEEQQRGLAYLDEWLAAESAMEETMDILEQDGWF
jgi:plasmid stabilization system protein ParE